MRSKREELGAEVLRLRSLIRRIHPHLVLPPSQDDLADELVREVLGIRDVEVSEAYRRRLQEHPQPGDPGLEDVPPHPLAILLPCKTPASGGRARTARRSTR